MSDNLSPSWAVSAYSGEFLRAEVSRGCSAAGIGRIPDRPEREIRALAPVPGAVPRLCMKQEGRACQWI